ncbi:MAG: hypothetical protein QXP70_00435 [Methanomassiliicoccales archaeon]
MKPWKRKGKQEGDEYEYVVEFSPSSIWAFGDYEFIDISDVERKIGKSIRQGYPTVNDLRELLEI